MGPWFRLAAIGGLLCVGFGAFAAHGITDPKAQEWLKTGALYGFVHMLAAFAAHQRSGRGAQLAPPLFLAGLVLFSGSLWAMGLGAPHILGAITPLGGLAFMAGWAALAWSLPRPHAT